MFPGRRRSAPPQPIRIQSQALQSRLPRVSELFPAASARCVNHQQVCYGHAIRQATRYDDWLELPGGTSGQPSSLHAWYCGSPVKLAEHRGRRKSMPPLVLHDVRFATVPTAVVLHNTVCCYTRLAPRRATATGSRAATPPRAAGKIMQHLPHPVSQQQWLQQQQQQQKQQRQQQLTQQQACTQQPQQNLTWRKCRYSAPWAVCPVVTGAARAPRSRASTVVVDVVSKPAVVACATLASRSRPSSAVVDTMSTRNPFLECNPPDAKQIPPVRADHLRRAAAFGGA